MVSAALLPFFVAVELFNPNISQSHFNPDYTFKLNKTTTVFREPLHIIQLTATIVCRLSAQNVYVTCVLRDIMYESFLKYITLNEPTYIAREIIPDENNKDWFRIKFNNTGVEKILVSRACDKRDIIKEIASQFNMGNELNLRESSRFWDDQFEAKETTLAGRCNTRYMIRMRGKENERQDTHFRVVFPDINFEETKYVEIEKIRSKCEYSKGFFDFLNGLEVTQYSHSMKVFDDQFQISTIMNVELPADPWNEKYKRVFKETTLLNLTNVEPQHSNNLRTPYNNFWTDTLRL
ncbi:uncharacterized protein LOC105200652 isoform X2 [Solenopsis invicta]|uniref:uncharacterized protein LOC105200652 isoform X2 n=1 Tax=Solenopsis invicta TaxID=13686 RepID=UPI000595DB2E|nr:uncharacterized protein LOC105200652 isoform X2 [Solenopsis invicta]